MSKQMVTVTMPTSEMAKFDRWIDSQKQETKEQCQVIIEGTIRHIENKAKGDAPVNHGYLRSSIHSQIFQGGLGGSVYTARKYGPYKEWGTGKRVNVPTFVKEMFGVDSMEWKGAGIREVNLKPHPYLFENARVGYNEMINKLKAQGFK
jgi:hypothetical protein